MRADFEAGERRGGSKARLGGVDVERSMREGW